VRAWRDRSAIPFLVMGAALGLLLLLAFLQYQWIGQLGEAERERLRIHLRAALSRLAQEFNAELARALAMLAPVRAFPPERELEELAQRWQTWKESAPHPELVRAYYVTEGGEDGLDRILVFRQDQGSFQPSSWPERLQPLRTRLALRAGERGRGLAGWRALLDDENNILAAPRGRRPSPERLRQPIWGPRLEQPASPEGWAIVELDHDFLVKVLLPELVDRHFRRAEGFDFLVQVVRRSDRRVLYRSDPSLPEEPMTSPDATAGIFELRPGLMRWLAEIVPGPAGGLPPEPAGPLRVEPEGRWQVLAKHRAGSLEAAVNRLRWRNLALSSAILLLMAASFATLIISAQRAQRLARLQMEFVAGVSHELRTPLAVICSAGDNLADGLVAGGEQARRYGALIRNEARRLTEMVEQILAFAGAQAGRVKYHFEPVMIGSVIERVVAATQPAAQEAGVTLEVHVDPAAPPVLADSPALAQAIRNLVSNALKYASAGKWVGIRAQATDSGRWLEIRVEDRGPGIPPADLPHVFEPFYRGRNASDAQIHGAGLGLTLAKGVVEAHRGFIRVESRTGEGAAFIIRLPAAEQAPPPEGSDARQ
jgi:signal transduction histidine kinase